MKKSPLLEVRDLVKVYPGGVKAVNGVSFQIPEGLCFGLLGPNGAGKSTTLGMIEGILPATSGDILFRGDAAGPRLRERAGIQFQETAIQDYLTVREVLAMFSSFYSRRGNLDDIIRLCDLGDFIDRDSHELSGGQRQRMLLAVALVNDPELLFLDEPTTGLDPGARRQFWDLVRTLKKQGRTIVLTTHYMEEAYALCDEIVILAQGRILAEGRPDRLLAEHFDSTTLLLPRSVLPEALLEGWIGESGSEWLEYSTRDVNATLAELLQKGVSLQRLQVRASTLEDLFLRITAKEGHA